MSSKASPCLRFVRSFRTRLRARRKACAACCTPCERSAGTECTLRSAPILAGPLLRSRRLVRPFVQRPAHAIVCVLRMGSTRNRRKSPVIAGGERLLWELVDGFRRSSHLESHHFRFSVNAVAPGIWFVPFWNREPEPLTFCMSSPRRRRHLGDGAASVFRNRIG